MMLMSYLLPVRGYRIKNEVIQGQTRCYFRLDTDAPKGLSIDVYDRQKQ